MNARTSGTYRRSLAALLVAAQLAGPVLAIAAAAPPRTSGSARATTARKPHALVARALALYGQARYDEAVTTLLGPVSRAELQGADLRDARIVLARCYVKKGLSARAEEHFKAVLAADPSFELASPQADAEEIEAFRAVKPAPASAPVATTTPAPPEPREKTPAMKAALPPSSGASDKKGWLSSHKGLALLVVVAGGGAAAALAGGGGGGSSTGPVTPTVPDFPPPPNR